MSKVITFSRTFPAYHPKKGKPTYFVEKFWRSVNYIKGETILQKELKNLNEGIDGGLPKNHTIRAGNRFKKGDYFSPRVWSGKPYNSKQIIIAPDTLITDVWDFEVSNHADIYVNGKCIYNFCDEYNSILQDLAHNDGLVTDDLMAWFQYPKPFKGQIICWNESVKY